MPLVSRNEHEHLKVGGLLHPLDIPKGKWKSISMDFINGLPRTNCSHDSIWVVFDMLTRLVKFIPTRKEVKLLNWQGYLSNISIGYMACPQI